MKTQEQFEKDFNHGIEALSAQATKYKNRVAEKVDGLRAKVNELDQSIDALTEEVIEAELAGILNKAESARKNAVVLSTEKEQLLREINAYERATVPTSSLRSIATDVFTAAQGAYKAHLADRKTLLNRRTKLEAEIATLQKNLEGVNAQLDARSPEEYMAAQMWAPEIRPFIFGVVAPMPTTTDEYSLREGNWEPWVVQRLIRGEEMIQIREPEKDVGKPYQDPWAESRPAVTVVGGFYEGPHCSAVSKPEAVRRIEEENN